MLWNRVFSLPVSARGEGRGVCQASRVYHLAMRKCCGFPFCPCLFAYASVQLNCPENPVLVSTSPRCVVLQSISVAWDCARGSRVRSLIFAVKRRCQAGYSESGAWIWSLTQLQCCAVYLGQGSSGLLSKIFRCLRAFFSFKGPSCPAKVVFSFGMTWSIGLYKRSSGPGDLKDQVVEQQTVQLKFPSFISD